MSSWYKRMYDDWDCDFEWISKLWSITKIVFYLVLFIFILLKLI